MITGILIILILSQVISIALIIQIGKNQEINYAVFINNQHDMWDDITQIESRVRAIDKKIDLNEHLKKDKKIELHALNAINNIEELKSLNHKKMSEDTITEHIEDLPREVSKINVDSLIDNLTNLKKKYEKKGYRNIEVSIREDLGILDMSLFGDRDLTEKEKYEDERIAVIFRTKSKTSKGETRNDLLNLKEDE